MYIYILEKIFLNYLVYDIILGFLIIMVNRKIKRFMIVRYFGIWIKILEKM